MPYSEKPAGSYQENRQVLNRQEKEANHADSGALAEWDVYLYLSFRLAAAAPTL